ncbi:pyridoxamine 5'-phosphate oxidase family protein [Georhizobium sp. MAB10]|uniref:pyridoxamine 5'-phosphate oxidase family protein n=1 Tax=Georhizobium sp. MAB10 TaxID=3028319 RepID=UPI00385573A3
MITEMTTEDCMALLYEVSTGSLACALGDQPYVIPILFAAEPGHLYGFTTLGRKVEWMRQNPRVCVLVDRIEHRESWESVIVIGRYEEISPNNGHEGQRHHAWSLLQANAGWWEPGYQHTRIGDVDRPLLPVFFRIAIVEMTGRRCAAEKRAQLPPQPGFVERMIGRFTSRT